jgi:cell division septum initiation protein DivIVA
MMNAVEKRAHQLLQELEEVRGENEFLNQEVARYAAADGGKPAPTPPRKRPG